MVITKTAKWELKETRRSAIIYRRRENTGTSGGKFMTAGTLFDTLRAAREYIDGLPVGYTAGMGQIITGDNI
jgi:hypothetical protein